MIGQMGHAECVEGTRNAYKGIVGKSEGKRGPARPRHKWENPFQKDFK
jgi:hypothetical protein